MLKAYIANLLWKVSCKSGWRRFNHSINNIEKAQRDLLLGIVKKNRKSRFGQAHFFSSVRTVADFQDQVPVSTFEDYATSLDEIGRCAPSVLTAEKVLLLEPTSGSSSAAKLIPYTAMLRRQFQAGIEPWIYNLFTAYPQLMGGGAYWSISPLTDGPSRTAGGLPIGFEADTDYLGLIGNLIESTISAVPNDVKELRAVENFQYVTLLFLLGREDLRLISIWNPTFLTILLDLLPTWWERLLHDLRCGEINPPEEGDGALISQLAKRLRANPRRAQALHAIGPSDVGHLWPQLTLISAWADGAASHAAQRMVTDLFPDVHFQGKGLIATEAFVSIPIVGQQGCALSINSHFFEFLAVGTKDSQVYLAHQLKPDHQYEILVTTGGGLYRYRLHDIIEVIGHYGQVPMIRFLGKTDIVSDQRGEKLNEQFVSNEITDLLNETDLMPKFVLLAPYGQDDSLGYRLYLELPAAARESARQIAIQLDKRLRKNFHYNYCRRLGQLQPLQIEFVSDGSAGRYLENSAGNGQKLGDIKPAMLRPTPVPDWLFSVKAQHKEYS